MDDHRELADGVFLTRYSNGEETVVNYGDKAIHLAELDGEPARIQAV